MLAISHLYAVGHSSRLLLLGVGLVRENVGALHEVIGFYIANLPTKVGAFYEVDTTIANAGEEKLKVSVYGKGATDLEFHTIN